MDHGDDGVMTEQDDDFTAPLGRASALPRAHRVRASRSVRDEIRPLLDLGQSNRQIAETLDLPIATVNRAVGRIDSTRMKAIRLQPDAEKGRLYRRYEQIAAQSLAEQKVLDPKGNRVEISPTAANVSNAIKATQGQSKLTGLDAPSQSMSVSAHFSAVNPQAQQALIHDPEYCRLVMLAEERERVLLAQGPRHVAGEVRELGEQGTVVLPAPPGAPEPEDDGRGAAEDLPPGDLHAPEARQERIPLEVVPGVVSGHLPRSEGDLGRV